MYSDKQYKATKQIMLGKSKMNSEFRQLAYFIDKTFGVKTINIIYDSFGKDKRPRLNICFEYQKEKQIFYDTDGLNFDSKKQKTIAGKFREILKEQGIITKKSFWGLFSETKNTNYKFENIWIFYSAFEPIAKAEANEKIPQEKVVELKTQIANKDIWEISRCFSGTTFFLYTEEQVKFYENSELIKEWSKKYHDLLEQYDEFGYFEQNSFTINLDSKENFDKNYQSNWFYYYK